MKTIFWAFAEQTKFLTLWLLGVFPHGPGTWLRSCCLPFFLRSLGENTLIQHGFRITNPELVKIGSNCVFGQGVFITGGGGVRIGNWVGLGPDVKIWSVNHRFQDIGTPWLLQGYEKKEVVIEDDVWLGANSFVMPGVTIHHGAIISAGTVVTRSVQPYAIFAGNPGRVIGWRKTPENIVSASPIDDAVA